MMSRYQNKSVKEIAGLLDVTVKGADYHIGKALQALRKNLKDYLSTFLSNFFHFSTSELREWRVLYM